MSEDPLKELTSWHSPWAGLRVLVVGLGQTGFAVVDTLCELGCDVSVAAATAHSDLVNLAEVVGAQVTLGEDPQRAEIVHSGSWDLAVVSPGVEAEDPVIQQLQNSSIPVWSDLELAWRLRDKGGDPADWIMVLHGPESDTAVDVAQRIFQAAELPTRVVGFGAPPVLDALREPRPYAALIVQVAAPSLRWRSRFPESHITPRVTVSLETEGTGDSGVFFDGTTQACVYRKAVGPSEAQVQDADVVEGARAIGIGLDSPGMSDIGLVEGIIVDRAFLDDRANQALEISTLDELREAGWRVPEQLPALLAAIAMTRSQDVAPALIAGVLSLP